MRTLTDAEVEMTSGAGGQAVIDCMEDAYSGHGWVSVWATLQSAWLPQTLGAIALLCIVTSGW